MSLAKLKPFTQEEAKVLTRKETMARLRLKAATFSKLTNGKIKGLPPLRFIRVGRKQLFLATTVEQWLLEAEDTCSAGR
jgi:hypothetical protein